MERDQLSKRSHHLSTGELEFVNQRIIQFNFHLQPILFFLQQDKWNDNDRDVYDCSSNGIFIAVGDTLLEQS